jgi:hypothetical protein
MEESSLVSEHDRELERVGKSSASGKHRRTEKDAPEGYTLLN